MVEGVIMSNRERGHSERAQSWLDIKWVDPPNAEDDGSTVQAFIDKLSQAIKALPRRKRSKAPSIGALFHIRVK